MVENTSTQKNGKKSGENKKNEKSMFDLYNRNFLILKMLGLLT